MSDLFSDTTSCFGHVVWTESQLRRSQVHWWMEWCGKTATRFEYSAEIGFKQPFHKFKNFMDSLPTKTPPHVAIGGATQPEDVSQPPDVTSGYESRDDVFYKAEVGYCYHLGIFGAVLGFVSCGLSLYQSWRDSNMSSGVQRL